jgi:hypothetical protein
MRDEVAEIAVLDIRLRIPREGFDGRPLLLRRARQAARRREEPLGAWYRHPPPIQSRARLRSSRIGSKRDLPLGFGGSSVLFGRNEKRRGVDEGRRTNKQRKRENNIYVFGVEITVAVIVGLELLPRATGQAGVWVKNSPVPHVGETRVAHFVLVRIPP